MVHLFICPTYGRSKSESEFWSLLIHCQNAFTDSMICCLKTTTNQTNKEGCFLKENQPGMSKLNVVAPLSLHAVPYLFRTVWGKWGVSLLALLFPSLWGCLMFFFGLQHLRHSLPSYKSQTANMQLVFDFFF